MKYLRVAGTSVLELADRELSDSEAIAEAAIRAEVDMLVYSPPADAAVELERVGDMQPDVRHDEPPPVRKPERLDNPARLDALRVALASHGLELRYEGAFYSRIEPLRAAGKRARR